MALSIEVRDLKKRYGRIQALKGVSLFVPAGSVLGLVGPNGAGKSTFLRVLMGLTRPSRGRVLVGGKSLWPSPERVLASVGGFVDAPAFYPFLSGAENLGLLADFTRQPRARILETLDYVGLVDRASDRVSAYSHGMQQRLGIAAALLKRPDVLVLDEPADGLDPKRLDEMRRLLARLHREFGMTLILSSHLLLDVERLCDNIAVFEWGCLGYFGPPDGLGTSAFVEVLWEAYPRDRALAELNGMGIGAQPIGEQEISATVELGLDLGRVNRVLMDRGVELHTVVRRKASLETRLLAYLEERHADVR